MWTDRVVTPDGSVIGDPLPGGGRPDSTPRPVVGSPPATPAFPGGRAPAPAGPPRHGRMVVGYRPGLGLAVGIAGLVVVALSLFVLKWADADNGTFLDLSEAVGKAGGDGADQVIYTYAAFGGFALFGLAVVWVLLAGVPIPASRGGDTYQRIVGAAICGGAAVYQAAAVTHLFRGPAAPEIGAWLGVIGYFVIVLGMVIGARRVRA